MFKDKYWVFDHQPQLAVVEPVDIARLVPELVPTRHNLPYTQQGKHSLQVVQFKSVHIYQPVALGVATSAVATGASCTSR